LFQNDKTEASSPQRQHPNKTPPKMPISLTL
jgi:hypothetical protein